MSKNYLLGCDWGTSSFRLRLIQLPDRSVVGEVCSSEGIASTYTAWQATPQDRLDFFREHIKKKIALLSTKTGIPLKGTNIVISGMASSTIGMCEVPYAHAPLDLRESRARALQLDATADFPHEILLISGVRTEHDVMRGEETQLIGLMEYLSLPPDSEAILILPGTHSKHLYLKNKHLVGIQTFMTGELYNLLSTYSILKDSLDVPGSSPLAEQEREAFLLGVRENTTSDLLKGLFRVRTNQLFQKLEKKENAHYLSGLLIGAELNYLKSETSGPLILCSGNNLFELYQLALEELDLLQRTHVLTAKVLDQATVAGQIKIYQQYRSPARYTSAN